MESRHWSNNGGKTLTLKKADSQLQRVFHENHAIFVQSRVVILMGMDPAPLISWHVLGQLFSCTPGIRHYWFFRLSGFRLKLFELPVTRVLDSGRATNPIIWGPQFNVKVKAARYKFYWENIYPCNFNYVYSKLVLVYNYFRKIHWPLFIFFSKTTPLPRGPCTSFGSLNVYQANNYFNGSVTNLKHP